MESSTLVRAHNEKGHKLVNGYQIERSLGRGAFGKVKLCTKNGNKYAIKIVKRPKKQMIQGQVKSHRHDSQTGLVQRHRTHRSALDDPELHISFAELCCASDDPDRCSFGDIGVRFWLDGTGKSSGCSGRLRL